MALLGQPAQHPVAGRQRHHLRAQGSDRDEPYSPRPNPNPNPDPNPDPNPNPNPNPNPYPNPNPNPHPKLALNPCP